MSSLCLWWLKDLSTSRIPWREVTNPWTRDSIWSLLLLNSNFCETRATCYMKLWSILFYRQPIRSTRERARILILHTNNLNRQFELWTFKIVLQSQKVLCIRRQFYAYCGIYANITQTELTFCVVTLPQCSRWQCSFLWRQRYANKKNELSLRLLAREW